MSPLTIGTRPVRSLRDRELFASGPQGAESSSRNDSASCKQLGQYHGAGVLTGLGLRLWHLAQR